MARKPAPVNSIPNSPAATKSPVRNSPIPRAAAPAAAPKAAGQRAVTNDMIARRAYEIWQSGQGGSEMDNWLRAERELRGARSGDRT